MIQIANYSSLKPFGRIVVALASLLITSIVSAAPVDMSHANYIVRGGDYNGDGRPDLLAMPSVPSIIDYEIPFIVYGRAPSSLQQLSFVALSQSNGSYAIQANPVTLITGSSVWARGTHDVEFGDSTGDGASEMLLRSRSTSGVSLLVRLSASGIPELLEHLSNDVLGLDLGAVGTSVEMMKIDSDQRFDLIVKINGKIFTTFPANSQGMYAKPPAADAAANGSNAWLALTAALKTSDSESAIGLITPGSARGYANALRALSANALASIPGTWSQPKLVKAGDGYAQYLISQTAGGATYDHLVVVTFEDGRWLIDSF